jgi:hypothetical protein
MRELKGLLFQDERQIAHPTRRLCDQRGNKLFQNEN